MELRDKVALVTGAAVRVGRAIALELARCGADVIVHCHRSEATAEELAGLIRTMGRRACVVAADLAEPDGACQSLLAAADRSFGRLDVLVNNAAVYWPGTPSDLPADRLARLFAVNVTAPTMLAERAGQRMADAGGGAIVNLLDIQARRPWPRYLAYAQTKAALWSATVGLARRLAPAVRVNGVAPGTVLWNPQDDEEVRQRVIAQIPLGRIGRPEDVARAVCFLADNEYVTGQVLCVDGGRMI